MARHKTHHKNRHHKRKHHSHKKSHTRRRKEDKLIRKIFKYTLIAGIILILLSLLGFSLESLLPDKVSCPQVNIPIVPVQSTFSYRFTENVYEDWKIISSPLPCSPGNEKGEITDHVYCGEIICPLGLMCMATLHMEKTIIDEDGRIGDTVKIAFTNEYDENLQLVKTVCLGDPDEIFQESAEQSAKEIVDFWKS